MIPHDNFTPHGYLDNPFHSWKLNPSGVLRSSPPLGMGWHVPNLGSYVRNQFQYTAHLHIGLKIGKTVLITPEDFTRYHCTLVSHLHTKNRFEYTCVVPEYDLTLNARYFLVNEDALGCILTLTTTTQQPLPVACYIMHQHAHNPHTSRLWEHGLYAIPGPQSGVGMLGIASEGDVFVHGVRAADGDALLFGEMGYLLSLVDARRFAHGESLPRPSVTAYDERTGWQTRTLVLPCQFTLTENAPRILNAVLARGVSQDQSYQHWIDGIEEIALAEANHRADDEQFWQSAPQLSGAWPEHWRRGLTYDFETLRMVIRPSAGVIDRPYDGMQIQAPRLVLAEAAMDVLFLSYADPELAAEVLLGHFASAPHPNVPCIREDGSYNMIADDGQQCGTAPEWGYPVWCCDQLWRKTGDTRWLRRLYPNVAAYIRWWLANRRDAEGWLVYACSWESGQDVSSRFGPQQTGGTIIEHVRPVDLQASMAQAAEILARWARVLAQEETAPLIETVLDFSTEAVEWQAIANEFTVKTRQMWQNGWFRDYDAVAQEWSSQQDTMHLAPVFCGAAGWGHKEQLRAYFSQPPVHSGWLPLSWPPVVMTLVGAAAAAEQPVEAAELAFHFIDASYRSSDRRALDEDGGLPGVTREYLRTLPSDNAETVEYANAGIEGYGWGAVSIHLLLRYLVGLREEEANKVTLVPMLPQTLRRVGATYRVTAVQWGTYTLDIECLVRDTKGYTLRLRCAGRSGDDQSASTAYTCEWEGTWGERKTLLLPVLQ